jgi:hypothetical protein
MRCDKEWLSGFDGVHKGGVQKAQRSSVTTRPQARVNRNASSKSVWARGREEMRTEDDAVELVGVLVDVGQQDAAGLQHCEELRLSWLSER